MFFFIYYSEFFLAIQEFSENMTNLGFDSGTSLAIDRKLSSTEL
jgi:hypothetical protein